MKFSRIILIFIISNFILISCAPSQRTAVKQGDPQVKVCLEGPGIRHPLQHVWPELPQKAVFFNRHLEPPARKVLHGIGQSHDSFQEYNKHMNQHPPVMVMMYTSVQGWGMPWMKKRLLNFYLANMNSLKHDPW